MNSQPSLTDMNDLNTNPHNEEEPVDGETPREATPRRRKWPYLLGVILTWTAIIALIVVIHRGRNKTEEPEEPTDTVKVSPTPTIPVADTIATFISDDEIEDVTPVKEAPAESEPENTDTVTAAPEEPAEPHVDEDVPEEVPAVVPEAPDTTAVL